MASVMYYSYFGQLLNFHAVQQLGLIKDLSSSIGDLFSLATVILPLYKYKTAPKLNMILQPITYQHKTTSLYHQILVRLKLTENYLVGLAVSNQEIMPNLNHLVKESMYFPHFYS